MAMASEIHRITKETLEKLKAEYHHLTTVGRTEIARVIEAARLLGDLSENGDYHAAKDDQGKMESRIRQIDQVIRNHEIVERDHSANEVQHASIVTVIYDGDSAEDAQEFFIGSIEEKPEGVLVASPTSPLGSALLGHKVGEIVEYEAPSGNLTVTIHAIR
jgi:transcription elongation factor GreA